MFCACNHNVDPPTMKSKKKIPLTHFNFEMVELPIEKIYAVHPEVKSLATSQSNLDYLLDSVTLVDADYLLLFLKLHPVTVVREQGKYYCIGQLRLLQVARTILPANTAITCQLLQQAQADNIKSIAMTDFYLNLLLFSLRDQDAGEQISRLWRGLDDLKKQITPGIKQLTTLTRLFGVNRKTAYLKRSGQNNEKTDKSVKK